MFDKITSKFEAIFKRLRGRGTLTTESISDALREVRIALLEADVNYYVLKDFLAKVKEKAIGQEIMQSLSPAHQFIKIVKDEITDLLGGTKKGIIINDTPFFIMTIGLQGSGKTTTAAKIAFKFKKDGKRVGVSSLDVYRPAAMDQLKRLGEDIGVDVLEYRQIAKPILIAKEVAREAKEKRLEIVIMDTAGRLHLNKEMMDELIGIKSCINPAYYIVFVADAMTGQEAVNIAKSFNETVGFDGVVLTKMDGDARGGAALSVVSITKKPIVWIGVGEKMRDIEDFYPDRIASRILGMGDILSLIEKAEGTVSEGEVKLLEKKMRDNSFTLNDFKEQLQQVKRLGSMNEIIKMIPGANKLGVAVSEKEIKKIEAIINSMTLEERLHYKILNGSRRKRIAKGSGTSVNDVNRLLKQFAQTKEMMKKLSKPGFLGRLKGGNLFN